MFKLTLHRKLIIMRIVNIYSFAIIALIYFTSVLKIFLFFFVCVFIINLIRELLLNLYLREFPVDRNKTIKEINKNED